MNTRMLFRRTPRHIKIGALALSLMTVSAAGIAQTRGGMRLSNHSFGGGGGRFRTPGFFSGRPFHFHHSFYGGTGAYFYSSYWPVDYGGLLYPPTVLYNDYLDNYRAEMMAQMESDASRRNPSEDDLDDYYLNRPAPLRQDRSLDQTVTDIEEAFRTGNIASLEKHVSATETLTVASNVRSSYSLVGSDYLSMTRDALKEMQTARFVLNQVEPAAEGTWLVSGRHILRRTTGREKAFRVHFVLKKHEETWEITEVGADLSP